LSHNPRKNAYRSQMELKFCSTLSGHFKTGPVWSLQNQP
jgi:hypothetical protein